MIDIYETKRYVIQDVKCRYIQAYSIETFADRAVYNARSQVVINLTEFDIYFIYITLYCIDIL